MADQIVYWSQQHVFYQPLAACDHLNIDGPVIAGGLLRIDMTAKAAVVLFFNDWRVYPKGVNAGGGESATMALARAIAHMGYRVICCANLPEGEVVHNGIEFWNFGSGYELHTIANRLASIGDYHAIAATLVHPFLLCREHKNCLSRILVNHAPSAYASGLEPATVMEMVDYMLCVSEAQRGRIVSPKVESTKIKVVKNGFDPEVFQYAGPEGRDWNQLIFIGRVEWAKGIHVMVQAFSELKVEFPDLKLSVFGDESYWPEFTAKKAELQRQVSGLVFHGKVPQRELAKHLQRAGMLVFPSVSFESAGLAVVDAQASGCPVVAFGVGGVPEYLHDGVLGKVVYGQDAAILRQSIKELLKDTARMIKMSEAAKELGRARPWARVAEDVMSYAERAAQARLSGERAPIPESFEKIRDFKNRSMTEILDAHDLASYAEVYSDVDLDRALEEYVSDTWPLIVRGIRLERAGSIDGAIGCYKQATQRSLPDDWQPFLRLAILYAERHDHRSAGIYADEVLRRFPEIPLRGELQQLISFSEGR